MNMPALKYSQIHQGLYTFINEDVLPTCGIEVSVFWQAMENLIADYTRQPSTYIDQQNTQQLAANTKIAPVIDSQQLIQAANSKWTSLFDMENGTQLSKDYLDQHFALASGSHADVKNYVVYYHHLLAFFEDGSQSGLVNPSQFVALCGHKCAPDSIILKQPSASLHTEVLFDRKGKRGSEDHAGIENILVETNETIIIDFNAVQIDGESKIQAYRNLQSFLRGDLTTFTIEAGQQKTCRMSNDVTFTDLNGDDYCIESNTPIQIQCANQSLVSELMRDNKGALAPQVVMDAVVASLMMRKALGASSESSKASLLLEKGSFTQEMIQRIDEIFEL
ncbi:MAG: malate synthase [Glaciecola sp.]|jgi:malate synthase